MTEPIRFDIAPAEGQPLPATIERAIRAALRDHFAANSRLGRDGLTLEIGPERERDLRELAHFSDQWELSHRDTFHGVPLRYVDDPSALTLIVPPLRPLRRLADIMKSLSGDTAPLDR